MNEEYLVDLYSWIDSQDSTFKADVDIASFKQKMQGDGYAKSMYDWIGSKDATFSSDVPYDSFLKKIKKKDVTGSPSEDGSLASTKDRVDDIKEARQESTKNVVLGGMSYLNEMITGIPAGLVDINAGLVELFGLKGVDSEELKEKMGVEKTLADYYKEEQERYRGKAKEASKVFMQDHEAGIMESIEKGNYSDALDKTFFAGLESAPVSLAMMAGGSVASLPQLVGASTLAFFEPSMDELRDLRPEASTLENAVGAITMAGAESVFSSINAKAMSSVYKSIIKKEGAELGTQVFRKTLVERLTAAMTKYGAPVAALSEGLEEVATLATQNAVKGRPIFEGAADAFIVGGAMGGVMAAPVNAAKAVEIVNGVIDKTIQKKTATEIVERSQYQDIVEAFSEENAKELDSDQIDFLSLSKSESILKDEVEKKIKDGDITKEEAKDLMNRYNESASINSQFEGLDLSSDQKSSLSSLIKEKKTLKDKIKDKDQNLVKKDIERIGKINEDIQKIVDSEQSTTEEKPNDAVNDAANDAVKPIADDKSTTAPETAAVPDTKQGYIQELIDAKQQKPEKYWTVSEVKPEEAANSTVIETKDGAAVVKPDGDITGVFKKLTSKAKDVAQDLLKKAVEAGGTKLDNFDNYLTPIYEKAGFRVVGRVPFNEEFAPEGWKPEFGKPDVVAMIYDPNKEISIAEKTFQDYNEMIKYRDSYIESGTKAEEVSDAGRKRIKEKLRTKSFSKSMTMLREKILDRQARIKKLLSGVKSKEAVKAADMIVVKAGAKGYANARFREVENKIFFDTMGGINLKNKAKNEELDNFIYARRIIAIVESRGKYTSFGGYNINDAKRDMARWQKDFGDKKFSDMMNRSDTYFKTYKESLKRLNDEGIIADDLYKKISAIDYSPIMTIDYLIGDADTDGEISRMAEKNGVSKTQLKKLTDLNKKEIITDSRWLLMNNISAVESKIAENRMLSSFDGAISSATSEELGVIREYVLDNKEIGKKKDGSPKYFYDKNKVPQGFRKLKFFVNGKQQFMVMQDTYADKLLDVKRKSNIVDTLSNLSGTQILRFFATGGNPLFIIGNTAVDFQNILFLSDTYSSFKLLGGLELAYDFVNNFLKKAGNSESYQKTYMDFMEHGGGMEYLSSDGLRALENLKPLGAVTGAVKMVLSKYAKAASLLGELSEVSFRMAVYQKEMSKISKEFIKENGIKPEGQALEDIKFQSARIARETIDFSQGGSAVKDADKLLPYLNAATQGFRKGVDYARSNPKGFAINTIQYAVMSSSTAAFSLAMLMKRLRDDDEEDKVADILNSVSEYEKANYFIFFTGEKDEEGEYKYVRIKKHPLFAGLATTAEQMVYKSLLKSKGIEYDTDKRALTMSFSGGLPIALDFNEGLTQTGLSLVARNPAFSSLIALGANYDTFTQEQIFREPNGKKLEESAKGLMDNRIEEIYKNIGEATGSSPAKIKVAIEKIVTSPSTNPTVGLFHSAYEGLFSDKNNNKEYEQVRSTFLDNSIKKVLRTTNKKILEYNQEDKNDEVIKKFDTDIYLKETEMYNKVKAATKVEGGLTNKVLKELVKGQFDDENTWERYYKKYRKFSENMDQDRSILNIIYEQNPEKQALLIKLKFGESLESEEIRDLDQAFGIAGRKLNKKTWSYYNNK